jgi:catechol 2,3-dioxygenase-like lactoylglutathione lyase family enzyme
MGIHTFADLCVTDVATSIVFYRSLLGLDVLVDHGWYAELGTDGRVQLALVLAGHETVPAEAGAPPRGVLVSFEVDDVDALAAAARALGCRFVVEPTRELGQHHFMVADPDGAVVDVIRRVPLERPDVARLARYRREHREAAGRDGR